MSIVFNDPDAIKTQTEEEHTNDFSEKHIIKSVKKHPNEKLSSDLYEEYEEHVTFSDEKWKNKTFRRIIRKERKSDVVLSLNMNVLSELNNKIVSYLGMAASRNKALYAIAECVSVPFDHLVLREPGKVTLFVANNASTLQKTLLDKCLEIDQCLYKWSDVISAIRLQTVKGDFLDAQLLSTAIRNHGKKILYYLASAFSFLQAGRPQSLRSPLVPVVPEPYALWTEFAKVLKTEILEGWVHQCVETYYADGTWALEGLPPVAVAYLSRLCNHCNSTSHIAMASEVLKRLNGGIPERCPDDLCKEPIRNKNLSSVECTARHFFIRCCRSLLETDVDLDCHRCDAHLSSSATRVLCGGQIVCTFCGGVPYPKYNSDRFAEDELLPRHPNKKKSKGETNTRRM